MAPKNGSPAFGNLFVVRRVSPDGKIVECVILYKKKKILYQIDLKIFEKSAIKGQSNLSIVFIFVSCEVKDYYRVVLVGQFDFDCHLHCGLSRRIQECLNGKSVKP